MSLKFNLQFFGGQASVWKTPKTQSPSNNISYSAPGIMVWKIPKSHQTANGQGLSGLAGSNGVVNDLAGIAQTGTLPKRYTQLRTAI